MGYQAYFLYIFFVYSLTGGLLRRHHGWCDSYFLFVISIYPYCPPLSCRDLGVDAPIPCYSSYTCCPRVMSVVVIKDNECLEFVVKIR